MKELTPEQKEYIKLKSMLDRMHDFIDDYIEDGDYPMCELKVRHKKSEYAIENIFINALNFYKENR